MPVKTGIQVNLIGGENCRRHKTRLNPGFHRGDVGSRDAIVDDACRKVP
jgi:hypothetical protein